MTTDRELDARLAAASGVLEADLPALPEEFLAVVRTGTDEPASVIAARQLVDDARDARTAPGRRRPGRTVLVRAGAGVLALAAAWTTAVVVGTSAGDPPSVATPSLPPGTEPLPPADVPLDPPGGLTLVAAEAVTFPYSLDPAPEDLTPVLSRAGGLEVLGAVEPVAYSARYRSAADPGFGFSVSGRDPREAPPGAEIRPPYGPQEVEETGTVPVDGVPAEFVRATLASPECDLVPASPTQESQPAEVCSDSYAELTWQRSDGQWVGLSGLGDRYGRVPALVAVAESIVDRPQPVALQFGLAPDGWVVSGYESPAGLTLVSAADPTSLSERVGLSLQERWRGYETAGDVVEGMGDGPVEEVRVNGLPAALVSVPDPFADRGSGRRMWYLGAQFADDGPLFLFQAPDSLTREDVLAMAEQVTYTP